MVEKKKIAKNCKNFKLLKLPKKVRSVQKYRKLFNKISIPATLEHFLGKSFEQRNTPRNLLQ